MRLRPLRLLTVAATAGGMVAALALAAPAHAAPAHAQAAAAAAGANPGTATPASQAAAPPAVRGVHARALSPTRVRITWTIPRAADYADVIVRRADGTRAPRTASAGRAVARLGGAVSSVVDTGLLPGHHYAYAVFGRSAAHRAAAGGDAAVVTTRPTRPRPALQRPASPARVSPSGTAKATGAITGTVQGPDAAGVESVDVVVFDNAGNYVNDVLTAADGTYTVSAIAPATGYVVCFSTASVFGAPATGYLPQCWQNTPWDGQFYAPPADATPVTVTSGATTGGVNASLQPGGAVAGRVTAAADGSALAGAQVTIFDTAGDSLLGINTDEHGRYSAGGLPTGTYYVCVYAADLDGGPSAAGYLGRCWRTAAYDGFELPAGALPVSVTAGSTHTGVSVALASAGRITGTITAAGDGSPVQNAYPYVYDSTGRNVDTSVSVFGDGTYEIAGLRPSTSGYTVCIDTYDASGASATGFLGQCWQHVFFDGSNLPDGTTLIPVTAGVVAGGIDFPLDAAGAVTGTVTSAAGGAGIRGVGVQAQSIDGSMQGYATTAADGSYTIRGLQAGTYQLCFDGSSGRGSATGYLSTCPDTTYDVALGATTAGADAELSPASAISGHVTSATDGAALIDADVSVFDTSGDQAWSGTTNNSGGYKATGLPASSDGYFVCVDPRYAAGGSSPTGYRSLCYRSVAWNPDYYTVPDGALAVPTTAGTTHTGVNLRLPAAGQLAGTVTGDDSATGLAGVGVSLLKPNGDEIAFTSTDPDGSYVIGDLAGSTTGYIVCFNGHDVDGSATGYLNECYNDQPWDGFRPPATATKVPVTVGSVSGNIDAGLAPASSVSGSVTSAAHGQGVSDVDVTVSEPNGDYVGENYTRNGAYSVTGLPASPSGYIVCFGTYNASGGGVATGYLPQCWHDVAWDGRSVPSDATVVPVPTATAVTGIDAHLASGSAIAGKVTARSDGAPLGNVDVLVRSADGTYVNDVTTDDGGNGSYRVAGLVPNAAGYVVCYDATFATGGSSSTGYLSQCYANVAWHPGSDALPAGVTPVTTSSGVTHTGVNAKLATGGAIAGTVTAAAGGTPLQDVGVEVFDSGGVLLGASGTDGTGAYQVPGLPANHIGWRVCFDTTHTGFAGVGYADECYADVPWDGSTVVPSGVKVPVAAGHTTPGIDAAVSTGAAISGFLTSAITGDPLPDGIVFVYDRNGLISANGTSDVDGAWTVNDLTPATGPYTVCFLDRDDTVGAPTGYAGQCWQDVPWTGGPPPVGVTSLAVASGATVTGIDAALSAGGALAGKVTDVVTGSPLDSARPVVVDSRGVIVRQWYTNGNGAYRIIGLTPGSYRICFGTADAGNYVAQCWKQLDWDGDVADVPAGATAVAVAAGASRSGINALLHHPPA